MDYDKKKNKLITNVKYYNSLPLFRYIEVGLLNSCNRSCDFCPVAHNKNKTQYMTQETFSRIIDELKELNFDGFFIISGFCEPFLHPKLKTFLKEIRNKIPKTTILVNTNGDFLNEKNILNMLDLFDYLSISIYDGEFRYNYFDKMRKKHEIEDKIYLKKRWQEFDKNNRAGILETYKKLPLKKPCYYPFYFLFVNWNGDIEFCPNSYSDGNVVSNLEKSSLIKTWFSDTLHNIRFNMLKNERILSCKNCDVEGNREGEKYFEAWKESTTFKNNK